jgi:cytidine deaminase
MNKRTQANGPHDADFPGWIPKVAMRIYACDECGAETTISTNHTGSVFATPCMGACRDIIAPYTTREKVIWHPARLHHYIKDLGQ